MTRGREHVAVRSLDVQEGIEERRRAFDRQLLAAGEEQLHRVVLERERERVGDCRVVAWLYQSHVDGHTVTLWDAI